LQRAFLIFAVAQAHVAQFDLAARPLYCVCAALLGGGVFDQVQPLHFGIIVLAAMEVGFLCPPAGLNIYFASARFNKSIRYVAASVVPALGAILVGRLLIALLSVLSTRLPQWVLRMEPRG
jgi:TRAP-type C4-dicarboxylate transport system permease large subunit